jgi:hypothetical protein
MANNKKRRKHTTTKNTIAKPPVHRMNNFQVDINGQVSIVTDISEEVFARLYREWFDHPATFIWNGASLCGYLQANQPGKFCMLKAVYDKLVIPATKEELEAENN